MSKSILIILVSLYFLAFRVFFANAASWNEILKSEYRQFNLKYNQQTTVERSSLLFASSQQDEGVQEENLEESESFKSFVSNFERIRKFNNEAEEKNVSFRLSVNRFANLKYDEFAKRFTGLIPESQVSTLKNAERSLSLHSRILKRRNFKKKTTTKKTNSDRPSQSFDWREKNVITPVKYQGLCGSCWAFSAVAALESHYAIKTGRLYELSEQQLVDCSSNQRYGNNGCGGGLMSWAFDYILVKGVMQRSAYKYTAKQESCKYVKNKALVQMNSYEYVYGENQMMKIVGSVGPVTVAIYASPNFQSYASGIIDDPLCSSSSRPNHAVVVIGYGRGESGKDYWIIKNSWGEDWGENGYARLRRGVNMCNIEAEVTYPLV